jgi:hypothetical protein
MNVKKIGFPPLLFLSFLIVTASFTQLSYSQPVLNITVTTDKQVYKIPNAGETVQINGNLTRNGSPVFNGLVALQVNTRIGAFIYRTLHTGMIPTEEWKIEILSAYIGDSSGNPLTDVKRGSTIWIWIWYQNNLQDTVYTVIAFTIYSANGIPLFAYAPVAYSVPSGGPWYSAYSWMIPSDAELGVAEICASAFSDYPEYGGVPHCPEKSSTFNIISSATSTIQHTSKTVQLTQEIGTFNSSFYIPSKGGRLGNYTIYVNSYYGGQASDSTKFEVILLGDANRDGKVSVADLVRTVNAVPSIPGDDNWDPNADINGDNKVNVADVVIIVDNIGNIGTY